MIITALHGSLESNLKQLVEKEQSSNGNKDIARKCKYISHFLSLLFASNREKPRVPLKSFNSSFLT